MCKVKVVHQGDALRVISKFGEGHVWECLGGALKRAPKSGKESIWNLDEFGKETKMQRAVRGL